METGTGTTVTPEEPVMVLDVVAEPEVVLTAMGKVEEASAPVDEAATLEPVSLASDAVALVSDSTMTPVLMTESVADAEYTLSVLKWLERPEFMEEAALDRMLENPEARDCVAAGSEAVAATPARSELNDEAKLERAADASFVMDAVAVAVGLPLAPEITDEEADETALERSEAAEETTPDKPSPVADVEPVGTTMGRPPVPRMPPVVEALAESSELVGLRMGPRMGRPPVPRMPPADEDAVVEVGVESSDVVGATIGRPPVPRMPPVVEAPVDETRVESSAGAVRVGIGRPPVPRRPAVGEAPVAPSVKPLRIGLRRPPVPRRPALDGDPVLLVAKTPSAVPVLDAEMSVPFAVAVSSPVAEETADAVPSMMVDRPTVIAPSVGELEASTVELLSGELGTVGDGSAIGAKPVVPTLGKSDWVGRTSVELAVGETGSAGRRPPVAPTDVPGISELLSSETGLWNVGPAGMAEPSAWLEAWVGCTTSSGTPPVEPTDPDLVVRRALLKKIGKASEGLSRGSAELEMVAKLELEENVG